MKKCVDSRIGDDGLRHRRYITGERTVEVPESVMRNVTSAPKLAAAMERYKRVRARADALAQVTSMILLGTPTHIIAARAGVSMQTVQRRRRQLNPTRRTVTGMVTPEPGQRVTFVWQASL